MRNFALIALILVTVIGLTACSKQDVEAKGYEIVKENLNDKASSLLKILKSLQKDAQQALETEQFKQAFFELNTMQLSAESARIESWLENYYATHLSGFYDVLFVDSSSRVFHTIKRESDYLADLKSPTWKDSALARALTEQKNAFVDFSYYTPSGEPAAFIIKQIGSGGHVVFQVPLNTINHALTKRSGMGQSGEVYLVNKSDILLTPSRFMVTKTQTNRRLLSDAIQQIRQAGPGNRLLADYRGIEVFSASQYFQFDSVQWLLISEIDYSEVMRDLLLGENEIIESAVMQSAEIAKNNLKAIAEKGHLINKILERVDIGEWQRTGPSGQLHTTGVATCTSASIYIKNQFGYLSHLPPTDRIYGLPAMTQWMLGDSYSDYLSQIFEEIRQFDVTDSQIRELQVVLSANESQQLVNASLILMEFGLMPDQIKIVYTPWLNATNVRLNVEKGLVRIFDQQMEYEFDLAKLPSLNEVSMNILQ